MTRDLIIQSLYNNLINDEKVYAMWLEGSDGLNKVDEYSDIDIVVDVEDGYEENIFNKVESILSQLGELDFNYQENVNHPKLKQKLYHIDNSSEYLLIDFVVQSHSRDKNESTFIKGDLVEAAKVLFDKTNVVTIREKASNEVDVDYNEINKRIDQLISRYKQHSRVIKYVKRNHYLEAYIYYMKYVVEPIVQLTRILYTPKYFYLHLIHISDHIPKDEITIIEDFYKVNSLEDIYNKTILSKEVFTKLLNSIRNEG